MKTEPFITSFKKIFNKKNNKNGEFVTEKRSNNRNFDLFFNWYDLYPIGNRCRSKDFHFCFALFKSDIDKAYS